MKKKLRKTRVALVAVVLIILIALPTFGMYVYNNLRDVYLKSRNFSFTSNLLTTSGTTYKYSNWSGVEEYEIDFSLYSYENEASLFTYDGQGLEYDLTCTVNDESKATIHIGSTNGGSSESSFIPNATNIKNFKLYLVPAGNLNPGEVITVTVEAKTTEPYKKTVKADFKIAVTPTRLSYEVEDSTNSIYATLKLVNTNNSKNRITLTFDPEIIMIDTSDEAYINKISQTTTEVSSGEEYANSVTIELDAEDSKDIKFYKKDKTADYTYPSGNSACIITIQEQLVT